MKKLRLIVTYDCNRDCPKCCNKQPEYWKQNIPVMPAEGCFPIGYHIQDFVLREKFDEVILTGGEPMLKFSLLIEIARWLRDTQARVYVQTALIPGQEILDVLAVVDGMTISLHEQADVKPFKFFLDQLYFEPLRMIGKSLRLNVMKEIDISNLWFVDDVWIIKRDIEWLDSCPLPEDEVLYRLA